MTEHQERIAAIRKRLAGIQRDLPLLPGDFGFPRHEANEFCANAPVDMAFLLAQLDAAHKAIPVAPELVAAGLCGRVYMIAADGETAACYCNAGHDGRCLGANDMPLPFPGMEQDAELRAAVHPAGVSPEATEGTANG